VLPVMNQLLRCRRDMFIEFAHSKSTKLRKSGMFVCSVWDVSLLRSFNLFALPVAINLSRLRRSARFSAIFLAKRAQIFSATLVCSLARLFPFPEACPTH